MNTRIKALMEQATTIYEQPIYRTESDRTVISVKTFSTFDKEKFAELIVKECDDVLRKEMVRLDSISGREVSAQTFDTARILVKQHFGIE